MACKVWSRKSARTVITEPAVMLFAVSLALSATLVALLAILTFVVLTG